MFITEFASAFAYAVTVYVPGWSTLERWTIASAPCEGLLPFFARTRVLLVVLLVSPLVVTYMETVCSDDASVFSTSEARFTITRLATESVMVVVPMTAKLVVRAVLPLTVRYPDGRVGIGSG